MLKIVQLEPSHLPQVVEVFNHYILHSTATFHTTPFDLEKMAIKVGLDNEQYASFAIFKNGAFVGYSTLMPWKAQEAYRYTGEVTLYLHPDRLGQGVGKHALVHLESVALGRSITTLIAGVCAENERSVALFASSGYKKVAHFLRTGKKFDRELDVVYLQKRIGG